MGSKEFLMKIFNKEETVSLFGIRLKVPLPIIIIVLLGIIGIYLIRYQLKQGQWNILTSEQYGYTISYPSNWLAKEYGSNGSRSSIYQRSYFSDFLTSSSVEVYEQAIQDPDLTQATVWGEEIIKRNGASDLSEFKTIEIGQNNYPALERTYTQSGFLGRIYTIRVVYLAADQHVFAIKFDPSERHYEEVPKAFEQMLASFRIIQ
jgi:xanthosine utilization system XapX-like protein